jgi:pimeloyl-ACP methyl ester carboxylesterase
MRRAVIVLGILALAPSLYGQTPDYQPPGRMVDVEGRSMHIHCSGSGNPTVVLEGGGGAFAIDWALVQPQLAASTSVRSYDRAGLGWSDRGPAYETDEQTVSDLHNLLQAAGEKGPFVRTCRSSIRPIASIRPTTTLPAAT